MQPPVANHTVRTPVASLSAPAVPPQAPDASAGSYAREEAAALSLLHRAGELPLEPVPPAALAPPPPPRPDGSCLADPRDFVTLRVKVTPKVRAYDTRAHAWRYTDLYKPYT